MSTQSYDTSQPFTIGTRGSPLALAQAEETRDRLIAAHGMTKEQFAIKVIKTTGDAVQDRPLSEIGGKGLDLPEGATFGSSSLRRRAQLLAIRPDLKMVEFRGNVQTRLRKLEDGIAAATLLARAGLSRLGQSDLGQDVPEGTLLPAIAQGAIGIEQRTGDDATTALLDPIHHRESEIRIAAERAFLRTLDGSCRTPIAGLAQISGAELQFSGEVLRPDGSEVVKTSRSGPVSEAEAMGVDAAQELIKRGASEFF